MSGRAVIAYIPALHQGYIRFFEQNPGNLYVLGSDLIGEMPRLDRDVRALAPEQAAVAIASLGLMGDVSVLGKHNLDSLLADIGEIVMPDEDVSRAFANDYLEGRPVTFISIFLRWDRLISTKELEVSPDRVISTSEADRALMQAAAEEAALSADWWRQVGAIAVRDGVRIIAGHNTVLPSEHALGAFGDPRSNFDAGEFFDLSKAIHGESRLIAEAARRGVSLEGADLYVTTFPCPVCAKSVAYAGFRRVYYRDGYSLLDAEDILRDRGVEIVLVKA